MGNVDLEENKMRWENTKYRRFAKIEKNWIGYCNVEQFGSYKGLHRDGGKSNKKIREDKTKTIWQHLGQL